ncbi:MAG: thiol-disulfide oxidoreductase DCC family protein [Flavobacteriaceae bacterium]
MVVFFDGVCNLCQQSVRYLLIHDKKKVLKFASLQGQYAKKTLNAEHLKNLESLLFYNKKTLYKKSDAVLELCKVLGGWHKLFLVGYRLPPFLRNGLYSFIAQNRYRWFGKQDYCMMPTKEIQDRFLE